MVRAVRESVGRIPSFPVREDMSRLFQELDVRATVCFDGLLYTLSVSTQVRRPSSSITFTVNSCVKLQVRGYAIVPLLVKFPNTAVAFRLSSCSTGNSCPFSLLASDPESGGHGSTSCQKKKSGQSHAGERKAAKCGSFSTSSNVKEQNQGATEAESTSQQERVPAT
jgi:hypothetical protein